MLKFPHFPRHVFNADQITHLATCKPYNNKYAFTLVYGWQKFLRNNLTQHIFGLKPIRKTGARWVRDDWGWYDRAGLKIFVAGNDHPFTVECRTFDEAERWRDEYERLIDEARTVAPKTEE